MSAFAPLLGDKRTSDAPNPGFPIYEYTALDAARPLDPDRRPDFVRAIVAELSHCDAIGPGSVHRAIRDVQRKFYDPPLEATAGGYSKYR